MASTWKCEVPECGAENESDVPRCPRCGAVRGETIAPAKPVDPRAAQNTAPTPGAKAELQRNMVFFYLAIWIPVLIWVVIVFAAC